MDSNAIMLYAPIISKFSNSISNEHVKYNRSKKIDKKKNKAVKKLFNCEHEEGCKNFGLDFLGKK